MKVNKIELVAGTLAQLSFESSEKSFDELLKTGMTTLNELIAMTESAESDGDKPQDKKELLLKDQAHKSIGEITQNSIYR